MPGYSDLLSGYEIDPMIPEAGSSFPNVPMTNKRRPEGGHVPDLTRWDDPSIAQALNLLQRSGQWDTDLTPVGKNTKPVLEVSKSPVVEPIPRFMVVTQNPPTATAKMLEPGTTQGNYTLAVLKRNWQ